MGKAFTSPSKLILIARYLLVKSDVEGAMHVLSVVDDTEPDKIKLQDYIYKYWPQAFDKHLYDQTVCQDPHEVAAVEVDVKNEPRWPMVLKTLSEILDSPKSLLDFGCSRGLWGRALKKELVNLETYLGVDTAKDAIEYAKNSVVKDNLTNMNFRCGDHTTLPKKAFDCVVCLEVLEHVFDFLEVLNALEDSCKHNGWIVVTTPMGAYEYPTWVQAPFAQRPHIRELRPEDWHNLVDKKEGFYIGGIVVGTDVIGDPHGTLLAYWKVQDDRRGFSPNYLSSRLQLTPKEVGLVW